MDDQDATSQRPAQTDTHDLLAAAQERLVHLTAERRAAEAAIAALERRRHSLIDDLVRLRETCDVDPGSAALSIDLTGSTLLKRYPA